MYKGHMDKTKEAFNLFLYPYNFYKERLDLDLAFFFFLVLFFFYCCSSTVVSISPNLSPSPSHPHLPPLILSPFGFAHVKKNLVKQKQR